MFNLFKKYYIKDFIISKFSEGRHGCNNSYTHTYANVSYVGIYNGKSYRYDYKLHSSKNGYYFWSKVGEDNISKEYAYKFATDIRKGKYKNIIRKLLENDFKKYMIEMEYEELSLVNKK